MCSVAGLKDLCMVEGGQSSLLLQGVVTYVTPFEAFTSGIKIFDWQRVCLIT